MKDFLRTMFQVVYNNSSLQGKERTCPGFFILTNMLVFTVVMFAHYSLLQDSFPV